MFEEISSRSKYDLIVEIASILANNSVDVNELDDIFDGVKAYLPETVWEDGTNPRIILKHYGEKEVGHKSYGRYRWVILNHDITMNTFDGGGNLMSANVSLSLQEYSRI